ncbi:MAG: alginate lyase family protein [Anaerolineae bacterium]|nr:alginate lyase family protein [Anaerolineae bacterium]
MFKRLLDPTRTFYFALRELGWKPILLSGVYRFAKVTRAWQVISQPRLPETGLRLAEMTNARPLQLLTREEILSHTQHDTAEIIKVADEIVNGSLRAYGGAPKPFILNAGDSEQHWSRISDDRGDGTDIKDIWEAARFGWVYPLIRAYQLSGHSGYPLAFLRYFDEFEAANPAYRGSNWVSGQEAAIRIIALVCGYQAFREEVPDGKTFADKIARALFQHAQRIPPTILYARSQNNNHLLSEAAGLYTAGVLLKGCKQAKKWRQQGWRIFHQTLQRQIDQTGEYVQHSTNYHRLMLHLALWVNRIAQVAGDTFPRSSLEALAGATGWLWARMEPSNGQVVNLGHHDGSHLITLGDADILDHRPTIQAASRAFAGGALLPGGKWDELGHWLGLPIETTKPLIELPVDGKPDQRLNGRNTWGILRSARYTSRPAHADQLHLDLWINGTNALIDAGTYRYTAPTPWRNTLAGSAAHNTITIDEQDQMLRRGRFMWLKWATAKPLPPASKNHMAAHHDGYTTLGCIHQREVTLGETGEWRILDSIQPHGAAIRNHRYRLHWLLPLGEWHIEGDSVRIHLDKVVVTLMIRLTSEDAPHGLSVIKAGVCQAGNSQDHQILGWHSPTYGQLNPAISVLFEWAGKLPTQVETIITHKIRR